MTDGTWRWRTCGAAWAGHADAKKHNAINARAANKPPGNLPGSVFLETRGEKSARRVHDMDFLSEGFITLLIYPPTRICRTVKRDNFFTGLRNWLNHDFIAQQMPARAKTIKAKGNKKSSAAIGPAEFEIVAFRSAKEWTRWLAKNHASAGGVWLQFFKKSSGIVSLAYAEALDAALCHGWIDGQAKGHDEESWIHKFTPRRPKSLWSKRNREHVARLIKAGKMRRAGMKQVEAAKADGRWERAYDSPGTMILPEDFLKALARNKPAQKFFASLNKTNTYAITWRLQTALTSATREKRMRVILEMLARGKKFHG